MRRWVIGIARHFGNQRIVAARLVVGRREERVIERLRAHPGITTQGKAVEVIKGTDNRQRDVAAFGRRRINVVKVGKVDGVFRFANDGKSIVLFNGLRLAG